MGQVSESILYTVMLAGSTVLMLWMFGAIYYDVCGDSKWSWLLALGWVIGVISLFVLWQPLWQPFVVLLVIAVLFLIWWFRQKPSHSRNWDASVAVLPRAVREGDLVTIENVRNSDLHSPDNPIPQFETRSFHLANLKGADIIFFNWGSTWMSHPVLDFDFGPDGHICISIEVRYRKGQTFSILRSMYRQQELIFLVVDERDVILRRTKYGKSQETHLYRFNAPTEELCTAFLDYIEAINNLYQTPRWYHGLGANCTTSFYRLPNSRTRFDWRVLANGRLDKALYEAGRLDQTLSFQDLRQAASLTEIANHAPQDGFGDYIRRELERRRRER
jgi:hypothetical protein